MATGGSPIRSRTLRSYPVVEFSRYEPYPDTPAGIAAFISKMNRFKNRINADEFMGFEPGTCFLYAPQTTREQINGGYFFKVTYRILIKADEGEEPFKAKPLCEGYMAKNPDAGGSIQSTSGRYDRLRIGASAPLKWSVSRCRHLFFEEFNER